MNLQVLTLLRYINKSQLFEETFLYLKIACL